MERYKGYWITASAVSLGLAEFYGLEISRLAVDHLLPPP